MKLLSVPVVVIEHIMSYMHLASSANPSSSSTPSSYLHINSHGGVSTAPSSIGSSSSSILGSIGAGKQWTTNGQPSSPSSSSSSAAAASTLAQQLMKQSQFLSLQQPTSLTSTSHFESILGSSMVSSSQQQMEKKVPFHAQWQRTSLNRLLSSSNCSKKTFHRSLIEAVPTNQHRTILNHCIKVSSRRLATATTVQRRRPRHNSNILSRSHRFRSKPPSKL